MAEEPTLREQLDAWVELAIHNALHSLENERSATYWKKRALQAEAPSPTCSGGPGGARGLAMVQGCSGPSHQS